jgi:hypothetical protein
MAAVLGDWIIPGNDLVAIACIKCSTTYLSSYSASTSLPVFLWWHHRGYGVISNPKRTLRTWRGAFSVFANCLTGSGRDPRLRILLSSLFCYCNTCSGVLLVIQNLQAPAQNKRRKFSHGWKTVAPRRRTRNEALFSSATTSSV